MNNKHVVISFKLFYERDSDIIDFLNSLGVREKSSYIRLALRQFIGNGDKTYPVSPVKHRVADYDNEPLQPTVKWSNRNTVDKPVESVEIKIEGKREEKKPLSNDELEDRLSRWLE